MHPLQRRRVNARLALVRGFRFFYKRAGCDHTEEGSRLHPLFGGKRPVGRPKVRRCGNKTTRPRTSTNVSI